MWLSSFFNNSFSGRGDKIDKTRKMSVSGSFYPSSKIELEKMLLALYKPYKKIKNFDNVSAIIVPHAGYVFSGKIAASAIGRIDPMKRYERIFVIGSSHNLYIDGASIENECGYYETPYGRVNVDMELCNNLIQKNSCFTYRPAAHDNEHCIEVQLPLLKHHFKDMAPIIPIIVGSDSIHLIMEIAEALQPYFGKDNLFVISTDFSHYPSYEDALKVDSLTAAAIMKCSLEDFVEAMITNSKMHIPNLVTSACGQSAIAILLYIISRFNDVKVIHTGYQNSGDNKHARRDRVVGYHSFAVTRDSYQTDQPIFKLSPNEKKTLLAIARNSIEKRFLLARAVRAEEWKLTENLKRKCGVFVTITKNGKLRGCIGHFGNDVSVFQNVVDMSQASAFDDPRFHPLLADEVNSINIEISVLTPMKRIYDIKDFKMGKHGIFMKKGDKSGTFLPKLSYEVKWDKEEFLGHCSRDKAGLGWDGWKDAELYIYEAIVFREFSINSVSL